MIFFIDFHLGPSIPKGNRDQSFTISIQEIASIDHLIIMILRNNLILHNEIVTYNLSFFFELLAIIAVVYFFW